MIYIYGLYNSKEPVTNIRYIGQAQNPLQRLSGHRNHRDGTQRSQWIQSVQDSGGVVSMIVLDTVETKAQAFIKENAWILFAKSLGWELVNGTNPGEHRSTLLPEFISIQDATSVINDLSGEIWRIASEKESVQRRWYRFTVGSAILLACIFLAHLFASGLDLKSVHSLADRIEAYSLLASVYLMPFGYGLTAWVILKDIPLYRLPIFNLHRQGFNAYSEWRRQMTKVESTEFDYTMAMVKRMAFHIVGVALLLFVGIIFS